MIPAEVILKKFAHANNGMVYERGAEHLLEQLIKALVKAYPRTTPPSAREVHENELSMRGRAYKIIQEVIRAEFYQGEHAIKASLVADRITNDLVNNFTFTERDS